MKIQSSFSSLSLRHKPINKTNRKNYLRPKLPISPNCPSLFQEIPNPTKDLFQEEGKKEQEQEQDQDVQGKDGKTELDLSSSAISNPFTFGYGNSFFKIALCGFGLFVFQTICTVWFLSNADLHEKSRSEYSAAGSSLPEAVDQSKIGDVGVSLNEPEFEKKFSEIRIMAKEARAVERKTKRNAGPDSSSVVGEDGNEIVVEDAVSSIKTEIRKELDQHLVRLLKDLRLRKEKNLSSSSLDTKGGNSALRKKPKSGIPSMNARNYPKGFGVSKNYWSRSESDGNGLDSLDQERGVDVSVGKFKESGVAGTEEEESWWLRDEVFEGIVKKVCAMKKPVETYLAVWIRKRRLVSFEHWRGNSRETGRARSNGWRRNLRGLISGTEVEEIMKTKGVMATVVRKGQLQLYPGQPLEDVERALHSILE
ncbi:uncharacterized protein LOC131225173 isoform X2 [Magnolia sinica]|uniref:uncharacterized protein LOC131225173 isoform X2 n=1 Tax=Magnolia sinica TaxID=86752 RepID=UPI002659AA8C|nr:uncharacterized protein LOC131225173 isoform X2 [Magnolia sinica]